MASSWAIIWTHTVGESDMTFPKQGRRSNWSPSKKYQYKNMTCFFDGYLTGFWKNDYKRTSNIHKEGWFGLVEWVHTWESDRPG